MQHAWAEIEHDRSYKFSGTLPSEIARRFKLLAGTLELIDREFDNIATSIDEISYEVSQGTKTGNLEFDLNTTTLQTYLETKFKDLIIKNKIKNQFSNNTEDEIITELNEFGIKTIKEFNDIIPKDFEKKISSYYDNLSFTGLIRDIMLLNDFKKYINKCFNNKWSIDSLQFDEEYFKAFGVDVNEIIKYSNEKSI